MRLDFHQRRSMPAEIIMKSTFKKRETICIVPSDVLIVAYADRSEDRADRESPDDLL